MTYPRYSLGKVVSVLWLTAAASIGISCQTIAGIEQRRLGPCGEYCDTVMKGCTGDLAAYANYEACMGVCGLLPEGNALEPESSNSVACRLSEARAALLSEPDIHCIGAGPTGGDSCKDLAGKTSVGCESYCMLYKQACGPKWYQYGTLSQCATSCAALRDRDAFDAVHDHDGDTLQCRLVHVSAASVDPETHCEHAALAPPIAPCTDPANAEPDCKHYCQILGIACQGDHAQYDDAAGTATQCLAVCSLLDAGTNADTSTDTLGCRTYHAYNSLLAPATHCSHAGPTGDGHCGTEDAICDSYCRILEHGCHDSFVTAFANSTCSEDCRKLADATRDAHYSVLKGEAGGATLSCRMLHAVRALAGDQSACAAAVGSETCIP